MNINFELYRIFYVVATTGSITSAAEELMISQPAVSKSIKNLEEQLGGKLFIRTKRGVVLTEEGKEFLSYIKQAISFIDAAELKFNELVNAESGSIRIGIGITLAKKFLLPYLEIFNNKYPNITVHLTTSYKTNENLINMLKDGLIDIAIFEQYEECSYKDIKLINTININDCFVVSEKYKDLSKKKISLSELNNYPLILPSLYYDSRLLLNEVTHEAKLNLKPKIELGSNSLIIEFAKIGLGIGYTTKEFIKTELEKEELYIVDLKEKIPPRKIILAIKDDKYISFSANKLVEIISE